MWKIISLNRYLIWRNIWRQKRRSAISLGAVALGIVALILTSGFIEWVYQDMRESTIHSQLGHLQIVKPGYFEAGKADPYRFLFPDDLKQDLLENSTQNNSQLIKTIVPRLNFSGLVSHDDATLSFIGKGVDPQEQVYFGNALNISTGSNLSADHPDHLIMGEGLARNLGVKVGDQIVLLVNTATGGINAVEMTIDGLFSTVTKSYDDNALPQLGSTVERHPPNRCSTGGVT